jgi:hypothetical protein
MDNQNTPIKGYRDLREDEIGQINAIKLHGENLELLCKMLSGMAEIDQRWVSIGRTHLQQGLMALVRAVAKPTTF